MVRLPPGTTPTDTLFPCTTLFLSLPDLPVDEGALGAERRAARIAEYAVEVAALGRKLRIGIEDVVGAQRERPAITVVINGRVEDPFGRVDVVVEIAGRTVFGHAPVAQGGAGEFPVVLLVCIGPDELGTGHLVGEQSLCLAAGDAVEADIRSE